MNLAEAYGSIPASEDMQPEGKAVAGAYEAGFLQDYDKCLRLIAWLLHLVNNPGEPRKARTP